VIFLLHTDFLQRFQKIYQVNLMYWLTILIN
jgi:hypothetical protein